MPSSDTQQVPTLVVECDTSQYTHQGAHAIRRSPTIDYAGGPIPEAIKKSYVQQQLPVRKQSLAAFNTRPPSKAGFCTSRFNRSISSVISETCTIDSTVHPREEDSNNGLSSPPGSPKPDHSLVVQSHLSPLSPDLVPENNDALHLSSSIPDDDEEFNFRDRPPSSLICVQPVDNMSPCSPEAEQVYDFPINFPLKVTIGENDQLEHLEEEKSAWSATGASPLVSDILSDDDESQLNPGWESHASIQSRKGSIGDIKPLKHRASISTVSLAELTRRMSYDTENSDFTDYPSDPVNESIFLQMQQKRDEQRKSIYAYRSHGVPVYPAFLSKVAQELYRVLTTTTMIKDDIEYHDVFTGKDAVDRLVHILRTTDRNLALLMGRSLDDQNFFNDVNYEHKLRDSSEELYRFRDTAGVPVSAETEEKKNDLGVLEHDIELPNGVFTLLTECYSPTCSRDQPCYSHLCPRKIRKDNLKQSQAPSLQEKEETHRLWVHSVSPETVEATPNAEIKRQECIYELIYTEEDFVKDLQYVHNFWVKPLVTSDVIPSERREYFVQEVFWNMADIEKVNAGLSKALIERQKENELVHSIGDVILKYVCQFDPFVVYGAHQVIGKFNFELEKKRNPKFSQFVEETERKPESRRLELNGYLTKPTTRLGRYNLLLREILKRTPEGNPDRETLPQVMELITRFLVQVNTETGKCENLFSLQQIHERLYFKPPIDHVDLSLLDPQRQLLLKGRMKRKGNSSSDASDLQAFLFDHYLVFAKIKYDNHLEYYRVYRKPIPIELLSISVSGNNRAKRASAILQYSRSATLTSPTPTSVRPSVSDTHQSKPGNLGITFYHHGRRGSPPITLYPSNASSRKLWIEKIAEQQQLFAQKKSVFTVVPMVQAHFMIANRVHNTVTLDDEQNGKRLLVGTDQGVYICKGPNYETVSRFLPLEKVSQIEVVNQAQLLVLADKTLLTFPLDMLTSEAYSPVKRGRAVSQNTAFFHVGECMGRTLVCVVKNNTLSQTTIRVLEPEMTEEGKKSKSMFNLKRLVKSGSVALKPYKDLYLPSEASGIQLLKTKICISSPREIGVIDMKHFGVQALLDPADEELSFVFSRTDVRPITIYRVRFAEYFVCYNEFAFFVDQRGRLIRSSVRIDWEGAPDAFAFSYPYIVAFEPDFIEVRNITNGSLEQLIRGSNIRCTNSSPGTIQGTMNDPENEGFQLLFQLDLHT